MSIIDEMENVIDELEKSEAENSVFDNSKTEEYIKAIEKLQNASI